MRSEWCAHLKGDKKEEFKGYVSAATGVLSRLSDILKGLTKTESRDDYMSAGWPYLRAYDDGYNKALQDVMSFLNNKEEG